MNDNSICEADRADFEAYIAAQLGRRPDPERTDIEQYLRAHPGRSVRDWKGKGWDELLEPWPNEEPWFELDRDEVREEATRTVARLLPCNIRQAAGRDPMLVWNPLARKYRLRLPSDPPRREEPAPIVPARRPTGLAPAGPYGPFPGRETAGALPGG